MSASNFEQLAEDYLERIADMDRTRSRLRRHPSPDGG